MTDVNLYQTAEALSEAVLTVPAIFDTLASAYLEAVLGLFTTNTTASIDVASVALAAVSFGQQPQIVQVRLYGTFIVSIMHESSQSTLWLQHFIKWVADKYCSSISAACTILQPLASTSQDCILDIYCIVCRQTLHERALSNRTFAINHSYTAHHSCDTLLSMFADHLCPSFHQWTG